MVPWLLLATLVFAAGEKASDWSRGKAGGPVPFGPGLFAVSACGGYLGARLARLMPRRAVRALIVAVGLGMSALFFVRG